MKKLFVIFMLLVIPLQASWALAAGYCQHEEDIAVVHFGHHDHDYGHAHAPVQDSDDANKVSPAEAQTDIHDCHGHTTGMLVAAFEIPWESFSESAPTFSTSLNTSGIVALPERPQWLLAA